MQYRQLLPGTGHRFFKLFIIVALGLCCLSGVVRGEVASTAAGNPFLASVADVCSARSWDLVSSILYVPVTQRSLLTVSVTVNTQPAGLAFTVDGVSYNSTQVFDWELGSIHTVTVLSPQAGPTDTRYAWADWSDGAEQSHTVIVTAGGSLLANFGTQYKLTTNWSGGRYAVSPVTGYYDAGRTVELRARQVYGCCYPFDRWFGSGNGSYSGVQNPAYAVTNGPITENAGFEGYSPTPTETPTNTPTATGTPPTSTPTFTPTFTPTPLPMATVTVGTDPDGLTYLVDSVPYNANQAFTWVVGSIHIVSISAIQNAGPDTRYVWREWSDGNEQTHTIVAMVDGLLIASFTTQYGLTMCCHSQTDGIVAPLGGFYDAGAVVNISAVQPPGSTHPFAFWVGTGNGSYSGTNAQASVTMNAPISETAIFEGLPTPTPTITPTPTVTPTPTPTCDIVLYDQTDNQGSFGTNSQNLEAALDKYDNMGADDFVVPAGETWTVREVVARGFYLNGSGPVDSFNVSFYTDEVAFPGSVVPEGSFASLAYTDSSNHFRMPLAEDLVLGPGTYWLSVQANMDYKPAGQWHWVDRSTNVKLCSRVAKSKWRIWPSFVY